MGLETKEFIATFYGKKVNIIEDEEELIISRFLFQYLTKLEKEINIMKKFNDLYNELIKFKENKYGK